MSASAVARNYAATLFELAARDGSEAEYGRLIEEIGRPVHERPGVSALPGGCPRCRCSRRRRRSRRLFPAGRRISSSRFLMVVLDRHRQRALPGVARAYRDLLDARAGRVRASVTLPFEADDRVRSEVVAALQRRFEREVVPEFHMDPNILGGVIIRVGDELLDASLRRQLERMRRELY